MLLHQESQNSQRQNRPTLGALNISLYNTVEREQWKGLCDAARQYDVNLLGFFGEALCIPKGFSAQANILYSLVNHHLLDGLIVFSEALESYIDTPTMEQFLRRFHPLPVVSVERQFSGIPAILMDNYQAMREVIQHLIEVHHRRRIAFIRGPVHHVGAQERYRAYCDTLAEYHLPVNSALVTPPVLYWLRNGNCGPNLTLTQW
jgi:DNA-binding LacI/PurR family transcriptional regulator